MMTVSHAAIGATTGFYLKDPYIAFLFNTILHFPLDKVPHFLAEEKKVTRFAVIDGVLTLVFFGAVYYFGGSERTVMLAGALGGVLIDALLVATPLLKTKLGEWHAKRQNHKSEFKYYYIDLVTLLVLLIVWWVLT